MKSLASCLAGFVLGPVVGACLLAGCASPRPAYHANNIYGADRPLPAHLRRVALLPLLAGSTLESEQGRDALEPVLHTELAKAKRFELVPISPEQLRLCVGKRACSAAEPLPPNLLAALRDQFGCDGVFFAELTHFQAYPPLAQGWSFKLVDLQSSQVIWAADELFDAADPGVSHGARAYAGDHAVLRGPLGDPQTILVSPTEFGHYTIRALVAQLAPR